MNKCIDTYDKIRWNSLLDKPSEEVMYPSIVKKIQKKALTEWGISYEDGDLTHEIYKTVFLPIYGRTILLKEDYKLNLEEIEAKTLTGIDEHRYRILLVTYASKVMGGLIYREKDTKVFISQRCFDKESIHDIPLPISLDYYIEKEFFDLKRKQGFHDISHGMDSHPRPTGIGLILFKLKSGYIPLCAPKALHIQYNLDEAIQEHGNCFVFTESQEGIFTHADLYVSKNKPLNENLKHELEVICAWAHIHLSVHEVSVS